MTGEEFAEALAAVTVHCKDGFPECPKCGSKGLKIMGMAGFAEGGSSRFQTWLVDVDPEYGPQFDTGLNGCDDEVDHTYNEAVSCTCHWGAKLENVEFIHE